MQSITRYMQQRYRRLRCRVFSEDPDTLVGGLASPQLVLSRFGSVPRLSDIVIVLALVVTVSVGSLVATSVLTPHLVDMRNSDRWFQSDPAWYFLSWTNRVAKQHRSEVHPLMSLQYNLPVKSLRLVFGIERLTAVRLVVGGLAVLWTVAIFSVVRLSGLRPLDALLLTILASFSSTALFMLAVPETYALGSTTMMIALGTVAVASFRHLPNWWYMGMSAATLSTTITNWQAGVFATFADRPWRQAFQISVNALTAVVVLWVLQKQLFPATNFFLLPIAQEVKYYVMLPEAGGPLRVLSTLLLHSIVMPRIQQIPFDRPYMGDASVALSVQWSLPGSAGILSVAAVSLWVILLLLGAGAALVDRTHRRFNIVLAVLIVTQLLLHILYGEESFAYVLNVVPPLIVLASRSFLTRARFFVLLLTVVLIIVAMISNLGQLRTAVAALATVP